MIVIGLNCNKSFVNICCDEEDIKQWKEDDPKGYEKIIRVQGHEVMQKFLEATAGVGNEPEPIEALLKTIYDLGIEEGKNQAAEKLSKFLRDSPP